MQVDLISRGISDLDFSSHDSATATDKERAAIQLIETIDASNNQISSIKSLNIFVSLTTVVLRKNCLTSPISVWVAELPPTLRVLDLSHNEITSLTSSSMPPSTSGGGSGSDWVRFEPGPLVRLKCLAELDLSHNLIDTTALSRTFSAAIEARRHLRSGAGGTEDEEPPFTVLPASLVHLNIAHNSAVMSLNALTFGLMALQDLDASFNKVQSLAGFEAVAANCPALEYLAVEGNPLVAALGANYTFHLTQMMPQLRFVDAERVRDERGRRLIGGSPPAAADDKAASEDSDVDVRASTAHQKRKPPATISPPPPPQNGVPVVTEQPRNKEVRQQAVGAPEVPRARVAVVRDPVPPSLDATRSFVEDEQEISAGEGGDHDEDDVNHFTAQRSASAARSANDWDDELPHSRDPTPLEERALNALINSAVIVDAEGRPRSNRYDARAQFLRRRAAQLEMLLQEAADGNRDLRAENATLERRVGDRRRVVGAQVREISAAKAEIEALQKQVGQMRAKVQKREFDVTHAKVTANRSVSRSRDGAAGDSTSARVAAGALRHRSASSRAKLEARLSLPKRLEEVVRLTNSAIKQRAAVDARLSMRRAASPRGVAEPERFRYRPLSAAELDENRQGELDCDPDDRRGGNISAVAWNASPTRAETSFASVTSDRRAGPLRATPKPGSSPRNAAKPRQHEQQQQQQRQPRQQWDTPHHVDPYAAPAAVATAQGPSARVEQRRVEYYLTEHDLHLQPPPLNRLNAGTRGPDFGGAATSGRAPSCDSLAWRDQHRRSASTASSASHPYNAEPSEADPVSLRAPSAARLSQSMLNLLPEHHQPNGSFGARRMPTPGQPLSSHDTSVSSLHSATAANPPSARCDDDGPHLLPETTRIADVPLSIAIPLLK